MNEGFQRKQKSTQVPWWNLSYAFFKHKALRDRGKNENELSISSLSHAFVDSMYGKYSLTIKTSMQGVFRERV